MSPRRPYLVMPSGQPYRPTGRQWQTLCAIAAWTRNGWAPKAVWPSDFEPPVSDGTQLRRIWRALVANGALERTPQGYRLLPSVRDQILAQSRLTVRPGHSASENSAAL